MRPVARYVLRSLVVLMAVHAGPALPGTPGAGQAKTVRVYVGTYTSGESQGIYRLRLDLATGALSPEGEPTPATDPSFLALSADGRRLYAVNAEPLRDVDAWLDNFRVFWTPHLDALATEIARGRRQRRLRAERSSP